MSKYPYLVYTDKDNAIIDSNTINDISNSNNVFYFSTQSMAPLSTFKFEHTTANFDGIAPDTIKINIEHKTDFGSDYYEFILNKVAGKKGCAYKDALYQLVKVDLADTILETELDLELYFFLVDGIDTQRWVFQIVNYVISL